MMRQLPVNIFNSSGILLKGVLEGNPSERIVVMCHGFTGDKSEWGKFDELSNYFQNTGYQVLRFDFSGCGESGDVIITLEQHRDDLNQVLFFFQQQGYEHIYLLGYSLGALVALQCYHNHPIDGIIAINPVTDKIVNRWKEFFTDEQLREVGDKGHLTKHRDKGVRHTFYIGASLLREREQLEQKQLLGKITCPVLIFHGKHDEREPIENSRRAVKRLKYAKLTELDDDHSFSRSVAKIAKDSIAFLKRIEQHGD